ncbi:Metallo-dependent phosphatase-like protein [Crucibulum laeve]|uniref:Metallo-dependent phosphatase-like protein n=1 Tax=Crucibulum laeve TaxID=68775 RepID=A0A5C3M3K2_9AGAR|nr:Metallo-dependent phosphatase-like protein [Crucibulum laeve]
MVSYSCFRFLRALRSMCAPITAIIGFSFLLTWIFILYQPTPGPGIAQRLGWQSWDIVSMPNNTDINNNVASKPTNQSSDSSTPEGVDWWNVTNTEDAVDVSSLPLDVWAPLLPHDTGLSEIAVTRCVVNPETAGDLCAPDSTSEQDAIKGKWVRVPRNLNFEGGYMSGYLNIYYRRTRRQDINLITNIRLLPDREEPYPIDNWHQAKLSLRSGLFRVPPLYLWYKTGKTAAEMTAEEKANIITELDILYGEDVPWYGFEKLEPPTMQEKGRVEATWLTYRRGVKVPPRAPPLHFSHSGKFKVLQVADLHYSVSQGICRDTIFNPCERSDNLTNTLLGRVLDAEKPDFVVFTGDQLNGQGTSWDAKSVLAKFAKAVTDRKIPWAVVFGNHDEDDGWSKEAQVTMLKGLPYSLVERGPKDIHGVGNYVLKVKSADASKTHLLTLYFLDSGSYSKGFLDFFGFFTPTEYDWIRQNQIDWFLQESGSINQIERPFTPDTGKDMGSIWGKRQSSDQITPQTVKLAKPNALMFFHMPLPESYMKADTDPRTKKPLDVGISGQETPGNAKHSDGFFEKGILKALESDHRGAGNALEVKAIGNGHCHLTENCRRIKGVWLCFGGGGSYSAYGKIGFDRRFRIYDVSDYGETIRTYKRTEKDEIVDEMILSGPGAPPI